MEKTHLLNIPVRSTTGLYRLSRYFSILLVFTIMTTSVHATSVTIGDREWRQLTETLDVNWNQLDAIYDTSNGQLDTASTQIVTGGGPIEFDGWKWASLQDVADLFNIFLTPNSLAIGSHYFEIDSSWAPNFLSPSFFEPTYLSNGYRSIFGLTRSSNPVQGLLGNLNDSPLSQNDGAYLDFGLTKSVSFSFYGTWLYKETQVPEPATMLLLGCGLLGLAGVTRRKQT